MHVIYLPHPLNRMTDICENITFPQLRWRTVIISNKFKAFGKMVRNRLLYSSLSVLGAVWLRKRGSATAKYFDDCVSVVISPWGVPETSGTIILAIMLIEGCTILPINVFFQHLIFSYSFSMKCIRIACALQGWIQHFPHAGRQPGGPNILFCQFFQEIP